MHRSEPSIKLLGFAAHRDVPENPELAASIRSELTSAKDLFGSRLTTLSSAITIPDLIFLRACIELRIPTIVILPSDPEPHSSAEHAQLAKALLSVSLAKYRVPASSPSSTQISQHILEWADAMLFASHGEDDGEIVEDAAAMGIPTRRINSVSLQAKWNFTPEPERAARHGFPTRKELLEFFDARFC